eukprot:TRINITY_DN2157_c0_g1_i1.p1 TRINITY_DN2157_c0_g1~~TRINITY_DN2157_c0_g1_i1.p1  ORF type:complete len:334 (+),score=74.43 TRINITY_DN2157_c0_g1_i1:48-1004(+)
MCGRGACTLEPKAYHAAIQKRLGGKPLGESEGREGGRYNVAPGSSFPVLREGATGAEMWCARWGLTGFQGRFVVNARGESVAEKATFRKLKKCVMFLTGFYEWHAGETAKDKQPYYLHHSSETLLPIAALYDETQATFVVITTSVTPALKWIHDRMPVILNTEDDISKWISCKVSLSDCQEMLTRQEMDLKWHPVSKNVGKVSFNTPECTQEISLEEKGAKKNVRTIQSFFQPAAKRQKKTEEEPVEIVEDVDVVADDVIDLDKEDSVVELEQRPPSTLPLAHPATQPLSVKQDHPLIEKFKSEFASNPALILSYIED